MTDLNHNFHHSFIGFVISGGCLLTSEIIGKLQGIECPVIILQVLQAGGYVSTITMATITIYFKIKLKGKEK